MHVVHHSGSRPVPPGGFVARYPRGNLACKMDPRHRSRARPGTRQSAVAWPADNLAMSWVLSHYPIIALSHYHG